MREGIVTLVSGVAALGFKAYTERASLASSSASLWNLIFPIVVAAAVFFTFDVLKVARHLALEVKTEAEQEIDLFPSLILPERIVERRAPSFYRLKIFGMSSLLIMVFLLACIGSWDIGASRARSANIAQQIPPPPLKQDLTSTPVPSVASTSSPSSSMSPTVTATATATVTPSPSLMPVATTTPANPVPTPVATVTPSPEPRPSPVSGPSIGPNFSAFMHKLTPLHKGYNTYHILSPARIGMCDYYVRLGMMEYTTQVYLALYVRQSYCTKQIFDNVANNYQTIVEDLKVMVKNDDLHILDLDVQPAVYVYSDDRVEPLKAAAAETRNGIWFYIQNLQQP